MARARTAAERAGDRAAGATRLRLAEVLRAELPGVAVTVEQDAVVLVGRVSADDPRLRWTARLLR